jgi:Ni/Co efflux regulator RcnB
MKSTAIAFAIAAASLSFGSLSYAQGYDYGGRDGRSYDRQGYADQGRRGEHRDSRRGWQRGQHQQREYRRAEPPQYGRRHEQPQYAYQQPRYNQRGQYSQYGHSGDWGARAQYRRGDHLPYQFRQRQHYVNDWRAHRLYAPPHGYQWVRADDSSDYLLVAIATGLIVNLMLNQ